MSDGFLCDIATSVGQTELSEGDFIVNAFKIIETRTMMLYAAVSYDEWYFNVTLNYWPPID